jgi:hypothetical protein
VPSLTYLSVRNELVGGVHLRLKLRVALTDGRVEGERADGEGDVLLPDRALLLRRLARGGVHLHLGLLLLNLLRVRALVREYAVRVHAHADLDVRGRAVCLRLDLLRSEAPEAGRDPAREALGLGVDGLELEGLRACERERLRARDRVPGLVRVDERRVVVAGHGRPLDPDGVGRDVVRRELADLEHGREHRAEKRRAARACLVLVERRGERLARDRGLDLRAHSGHARRATDELDREQVRGVDVRVRERALDRRLDALKHGADEAFHLLARELAGGVDVVHDALDVDRRVRVGGEDLLQLLARGLEPERRLRVREHVDLVLLLERRREVPHERVVDVAPAEPVVERGRLDRELAFGEGDNGDGHVRVADVDEHDVPGLRRVLGQIALRDPVPERNGRIIVHEPERVQARDRGGVEESAPLDLGVPARDGDDDVGHAHLELKRRDVPELAEVGGG